MFVAKPLRARSSVAGASALRVATGLVVICAFAACGKKDETGTAQPATTGPAATQAAAPPVAAVSAQVAAMSVDQLRAAASSAVREQRLYAPPGNNAMEYYLALRDKAPSDAARPRRKPTPRRSARSTIGARGSSGGARTTTCGRARGSAIARLAAVMNAAISLYSMRPLPSTSAAPRSADSSSCVKIPAP